MPNTPSPKVEYFKVIRSALGYTPRSPLFVIRKTIDDRAKTLTHETFSQLRRSWATTNAAVSHTLWEEPDVMPISATEARELVESWGGKL